MRRGAIGLLLAAGMAHAAGPPGTFAPLRYDDDFSRPAAADDAYAQLKHRALGAGAWLTIGGDLRERFEYFERANVGGDAAGDYGLLMHRLLLHADLHVDRLRVFVQLGNYEQEGREPGPKPSDVDHLDIRQAFVDIDAGTDAASLVARVGRQELAFGASRLVSARDGPNIRLAFDGARLIHRRGAWSATALAVHPAQNFPDRFDDATRRDDALWGLYATRTATPFSADLYYFGSTFDDIEYDAIAGREHRATFGVRLYGGNGGFDGDTEFFYQRGGIGGLDIRAFAWATDFGWTWRDAPWRPRIGLRTDVISGDRKRGDGRLGTFNALYPTGSYFSEASVLAQANLLDFAASLAVKPHAQLTVTWAINPLWRYSTRDALYTLPLSPLLAGDSSRARHIGIQNQLLAVWQVNPYLSFKAALVKFAAGTFVDAAGGADLDYAQFATNLRF